MRFVVAVLGVLIVLIGLLGLIAPQRFRTALGSMASQPRFLFAVILRLGMGVVLWFVSDELRFPHIMRIIAAISVIAAVGILVMGRERLDRLVDWWLARSNGLLRISTLFAALFGAFLVYVAA